MPTNGTISCQNSSDPRNGQSNVICENGQFTYTHDGSNSSSDSFTYKANDGTCDSNLATVTIKINIPIDPTGSWFQIGQSIEGQIASEKIGYNTSFSSDGSIVAIDSRWVDGGRVRVYKNINNTWTQLGQEINGENSTYDVVISLSGDGTRLAIGSWTHGLTGNHQYRGMVRVFDYINNSWTLVGQKIYGASSNSRAGSSVSLSNDDPCSELPP